ncbi:M24 family metallopeptidase [Nonomuraea soli]|uniref:Xaa-Pro aminopeptidase n=1 Tax=Nonomuraea soli TaxID=1032476 RepID=A0A7W0CEG5_9ACTN|nr:Xaa-Pro peptidase family protein [Nonomuraea soli]MBA2889668.1 Xaa-Pro aminopeptidase [Nonomuraea soli]
MTVNFGERRAQLAAILPGVPALLVTRPVNVRYLTGLDSSNAAVLVWADGSATLATDSRYIEMTRGLDIEVVEDRDVVGRLAAQGVGVEATHMTVAAFRRLNGVVPLDPLVEQLRMVKDEHEIELLRTACAISDRAFSDISGSIRPGVSEKDLARILEARMIELGADKPAFDTIVAAGENGAVPHHSPTDRQLRPGDLVTIDFGARYRGYHADMTRTVAVGHAADWQRELYDLVAAAQQAGVEAVKPGAIAGDLDAVSRSIIEAAGHGEDFRHGLGHGVGLEIHEDPFLGPARTGKLEDRVPVTVEPGVYLPGRGGIRIEDTLVARDAGPELLTKTTKELLVL